MPYIHELPDWPNLFWDIDTLASPLAAVRHRQGLLLGRMGTLGFDVRANASLSVLTNNVIKTAAIEGEALSVPDVRSSLARRLGLEIGGLTRARREVEGIVAMTLDATQQFDAPLTRERLFEWHSALFPAPKTGKQRILAGAWRTGKMQVISGVIGRERVHFEAPSADRIESEMGRFLDWFNAPTSVDPVLRAAIAHFWFVTIHPFEDGNGRIARAIADLMLARADAMKDRFYSMSTQIEAERREYYMRLESAQRGGLDITVWLSWFLGCLDRTIGSADSLLASVLFKANVWQRLAQRRVNARQRIVLNRLLDGFEGFLTSTKYAKLTKCSADTALRDIRELMEWEVLLQNDRGGRSTSYRLAS